MGLPDKIKNALSNTNSAPATTDKTPAKNKENKTPANKNRRPPGDGLPVFKDPPLPEGRRAILVACATTRRASWAVIKSDDPYSPSPGWTFERNLPAIPDMNASKPQAASKRSTPRREQAYKEAGPPDLGTYDISIGAIDFDGYSCGMCNANGSYGNILIRCGHCQTLQCQPAATWQCPGCGLALGQKPMQDMTSIFTSSGSGQPTAPDQGHLGSADSRAIPASARGKGKNH